MKIPDSFKTQIKSTFYDKEIQKYKVESAVDDEGWVGNEQLQTDGSFYGNVRYENFSEILKELGIDIIADLLITTDEDIRLGSIVGFNGGYYRVVKVLKYDSHNLILCNVWQSSLVESETSISA